MTAPTLQFAPGDQSGFTPVGLSGFQDIKPPAVVRELVQNALDAVEGKRCARVRFSLRTVPFADIPGIKEFRAALDGAETSQRRLFPGGGLPDHAQEIVESMREHLSRKETEVLSIVDNGVGLDDKRMRSLLGDGISYQSDSQSTGAYGNGHMVALPVSGLRYALYGGVTKSGQTVCSGHAVLASRAGRGGSTLSKDGHLVTKFRKDFRAPYAFARGSHIPPLIKEELDAIQAEWGSGTAVIIPAFNRFLRAGGKFDLWEAISLPAAASFFCAIHQGGLTVETSDNEGARRLDQKSIGQVLAENAEQKRVRGPFLSGARAHGAFQALAVKPQVIPTSRGPVTVHVRCPVDGNTRTDLCRNGMWITGDIPRFQGKFSEHRAFHCVIRVDGKGDLHRLVRKAEGPLHTELEPKLLGKERKDLSACLDEIVAALQGMVPTLDDTWFSPDDILDVPGVGGISIAGIGPKPSLFGTPTRLVPRRSGGDTGDDGEGGDGGGGDGPGPGPGPTPGPTPNPRQGWSGPSLSFRAVGVPTGRRSYKVRVVPGEDCQGSELRLVLDESIDLTCDGVSREPFVTLEQATIDGRPVSPADLVQGAEDRAIGLRMGKLKKGAGHVIETHYRLPDGLAVANDQEVVLHVDVKRRGK